MGVELAALGVLQDVGRSDLDGHIALGEWIASEINHVAVAPWPMTRTSSYLPIRFMASRSPQFITQLANAARARAIASRTRSGAVPPNIRACGERALDGKDAKNIVGDQRRERLQLGEGQVGQVDAEYFQKQS